MLSLAQTVRLHRVRVTKGPTKWPSNSFRSIAKGNPKAKRRKQEDDLEWMAHSSNIFTDRAIIPKRDDGPLPRKFNASGYIAPKAPAPALKAAKKKDGKKKTTKKPVISDMEDAKTLYDHVIDSSGEDDLLRQELSKLPSFGASAGHKITSTFEQAQNETKRLEEKQKLRVQARAGDNVDPFAHLRAKEDSLDDKDPEDELVDDEELKSAWKKKIEERMMKKAMSKSKKMVKAKKSTKKKVSKVSARKEEKKPEGEEDELRMTEKEIEEFRERVSKIEKPRFRMSELTFMEGSKEDLELFGSLEDEEALEEGIQTAADILGDERAGFSEIGTKQASSKTMTKSSLGRKKQNRVFKKEEYDLPKSEADADDYLDSIQKQDDKARQAYLDNYDQDVMLRPPIATYKFPAVFSDPNGSAPASVDSMGTWLSLKTRGIRFEGTDGLLWNVRDYLVSHEVASIKFKFHEPEYAKPDLEVSHVGRIPLLDKFKLDFEIPVKLATTQSNDTSAAPSIEHATIQVSTRHTSQFDSFAIALKMPDGSIVRPELPSIDPLGYPTSFDDQIKQIQLQLPAKTYLKTCWSCALSEYSPIHKPTFGGLGCFRQWSGIANIRDKLELLRNWSKHLENVQETHSCDSFQRRTKPRIVGFNPTQPARPEGIKQRKLDQEAKEASADAKS